MLLLWTQNMFKGMSVELKAAFVVVSSGKPKRSGKRKEMKFVRNGKRGRGFWVVIVSGAAPSVSDRPNHTRAQPGPGGEGLPSTYVVYICSVRTYPGHGVKFVFQVKCAPPLTSKAFHCLHRFCLHLHDTSQV